MQSEILSWTFDNINLFLVVSYSLELLALTSLHALKQTFFSLNIFRILKFEKKIEKFSKELHWKFEKNSKIEKYSKNEKNSKKKGMDRNTG